MSFKAGAIISSRTALPINFEELMSDLSGVRVIYIGEHHTDPAHHRVQLQVIKALLKIHPKMVVGMEMFDRTYQHVLDLWSAGKLDQQAFLRKVHWHANWRYDSELYQDILEVIRMNNIKLAGLNIPFHIPPKIARGGTESLSDDEKKYLPEKIDTSNAAHRSYVEQVFNAHHVKGMDNFETFYLAQCVWEDAMAESIVRHLNDAVMVVLAGNGHIIHKFGIPDRALERTGALFRTIVPVPETARVDLSSGDYLWITPADSMPNTRPIHRAQP